MAFIMLSNKIPEEYFEVITKNHEYKREKYEPLTEKELAELFKTRNEIVDWHKILKEGQA